MADAEIKIVLLPGGRVCISGNCMGRTDAVYASLADARVPAEAEKLLGKLRARLDAGVSLSPSQQFRLDQLHEAAPQASAAWSQARGLFADISAAARAFGAVRISDLFPRRL